MEKRSYGKTDMKVSMLGLGAAEIGLEGLETAAAEKLLGTALDAGLNLIDTAECYGTSEELIGKTVSHRRDDYYLFTKCGHASGLDFEDWDPRLLEQSIDRSLKRLHTDYVDVIHLHSCSEEILRRGEVIEVLKRAKEQGKTRYIGYSGDHQAALYAIRTGVFDSLETSLNIADQEAIELTLPEAAQRGIGITVKRPIANAAWRTGQKPESPYRHTYWDRLQELQYDFLNGDLEDSIEKALRFTLSVPGVSTVIVGTSKPGRWVQNARLAGQGPLPREEVEAIRARWKQVARPDWIGQM
ncbi:aldo/keto reductase [Paenibacillus sp. UNC499MF]|uniref:aldo/keto reductase n=1 Tax=Paenibacillus sp. UNC499MF TaxID=1502751 RepID=UPI0008A034D7|nr:aldo/keto reductase [Paenibacillus sp. UNC499MF]SEF63072.1 hypothetical protein SAMN02799616_00696 [Paenibacillus sp. UNC499MF]